MGGWWAKQTELGREVSGSGGKLLTQILKINTSNCGIKLNNFEELFKKTAEMPHVMSDLEILLLKLHQIIIYLVFKRFHFT